MTTPAETAQRIREALAPFVRPRDEATHIRRVLRAHLADCLKSDDALDGSLALVDLSWDVAVSPEARGLQRAYLRALQANLDARRAFEQQCREATSRPAKAASVPAEPQTPAAHRRTGSVRAVPTALEAHLTAARQARKRERLQVGLRYLDALGEKPAAAEDFMRLDTIHATATETLPSVPTEVLEGVAEAEAEKAAATVGESEGSAAPLTAAGMAAAATTVAGLDRLVAHVEKAVLRAQLLLRQEETRLAAAKARAARLSAASSAAGTPAEAKLRALEVARDELIAWMETELGNAAAAENGEEEDGEDEEEELKLLRQSVLEGGEEDKHRQAAAAPLEEKLGAIRQKYAQYIEVRRALVSSVESMAGEDGGGGSIGHGRTGSLLSNMPHLPPPGQGAAPSWLRTPAASTASTGGHAGTTSTPDTTGPKAADPSVKEAAARGQLLLIPYLERLLAVAREQKADITHKAHYSAVLAKRQKETGQMLDHLADESQLLPRYPMPAQAAGGRRGGGAGGAKTRGVLASAPGRDAPDSVSQRVAAWIYAAESAKIATFETVAEQLEEGQIALEKATETLEQVDALLGRPRTEGGPAEGSHAGTRTEESDIWATLNGQLGLLNAEEGGRRRR